MWILTLYLPEGTKMFEYDNMVEAREEFNKLEGTKILSEVIYYNDLEKKV